MPETLRYAGIDVAQGWLDVAIHGLGQPWRVTADEEGIEGLTGALREQGVHLGPLLFLAFEEGESVRRGWTHLRRSSRGLCPGTRSW